MSERVVNARKNSGERAWHVRVPVAGGSGRTYVCRNIGGSEVAPHVYCDASAGKYL